MSELKPCPFCGGKAIIRHNEDFNTYYPECETGADCLGCCFDEASFPTEQETLEAWNTRPQNDGLCEEGYDLASELDEVCIWSYNSDWQNRPHYDTDCLPNRPAIPKDGDFKYCSRCGREIKLTP